MIAGKYYRGMEKFEDIRKIRKQVFGEELGYSDELNFDGLDEEALHAVVYLDAEYTQPAAVGRLIITEDGYKIGRIAVKREARKHGYGDFIVHMLVDKAFQAGAEKVIVGASFRQGEKKMGVHRQSKRHIPRPRHKKRTRSNLFILADR